MSVSSLGSLFDGPQNLRAVAVPVTLPVNAGDVVATLQADAVFEVSEFQLLGGASAELVNNDGGAVPGMVLRAGEQVAREMNKRAAAGRLAPIIGLRVVAMDRNGNASTPTDVRVRLETKTADSPASTAPTSGDVVEEIGGPEALKDVASGLASIAATRGTPEWFDAYQFAMQLPQRCDANNDDFIRQYAAAYRQVRPKLTMSNLGTFYDGMCRAWRDALNAAQAEANAANANRNKIMMENAAAEMVTAVRKQGARAMRDVAMGVALSAVFFFMLIALFLAFLAIEGHSHAVRKALQLIAEREEGSGNG